MAALKERSCKVYEKGDPSLPVEQANELLKQLHDWSLNQENQTIGRSFQFKNYYQTIAFVNAVAWIANHQDHHPDLEVSYNRCVVHFTTHSVGGLSENDFICAAKIDALF
ncbi:MAG: 4a-hydroxytetrahydrobiopterin dehydratase [Gammaproteobacteria bacterium]|nr:4a-hydroxytetrahydrobiopterin dehydratase [Gammaproteobacteria bacterium]